MKIFQIVVVSLVIFSTINGLKSELLDPINVSIENPERGYLYIQDKKISSLPIGVTVILGRLTVRVKCSGDISKVKFYVDGISKGVDYSSPFEWSWDETIHGLHKLSVKAYDTKGNNATDEILVVIFNYEKTHQWSLTEDNSWIDDIPTIRDFIPIGIVHMETKDHILLNLPDPKWGLQCFIFVGWGETEDNKHYISFQGRIPIVGGMNPRIFLDGKWFILPATRAPMYLDDEKRIFSYPTIYTTGETFSSVSYDIVNRTWIFKIAVPSKNIDINIVGEAKGIPFWMGKAEGPYIVHGVSCNIRDIDIWGGFWDVGYCTIYLQTPTMNYTFYGNFLFDRAYHRTYYTDKPSDRGGLAYFSCMYIHSEENEKFDLMFSHSINPSPLETPVEMQHQARLNLLDRNKSYPLEEFVFSDDGSLQPSTFHFDGRFRDGEIHLIGEAIGYFPLEWGIVKGLWWNPKGVHTWGRAFVIWNGTITLNGELIEVKDAMSIGEYTRYMERGE